VFEPLRHRFDVEHGDEPLDVFAEEEIERPGTLHVPLTHA
jgi:hypothetical protein